MTAFEGFRILVNFRLASRTFSLEKLASKPTNQQRNNNKNKVPEGMVGSVGCMVQNVDLLLLWVQVYDLGLTKTGNIVVHKEDLAASGHWALGMRGGMSLERTV